MPTPDKGIQKAIVSKENLPTVDSSNGYSIRYRIVDENGTRTSHWSQKYFIIANAVQRLQQSAVTIISDTVNKIVTIHWDSPTDKTIKNFDVYVKWSTSSVWQFYATVGTTTYSVRNVPSGATSVKFAIQVQTDPKIRVESATLYETATAYNL
jgi:hypothetical protein